MDRPESTRERAQQNSTRKHSMLLLLFASLGLVLLLACTNVAGLLLARSVSRSREVALRMSLGATRGRIIAQLLAESLLLSLAGGLGGLVFAWTLVQIAPSYVPTDVLGTSAPFELNARMIGFTLASHLSLQEFCSGWLRRLLLPGQTCGKRCRMELAAQRVDEGGRSSGRR